MTSSTLGKLLAALLALAVVAAVALLLIPSDGKKHITAVFPRTVSLYEGSDVKILGVKVGTVDSVKPAGDKVIVKLSYDDKYKVPADAKAVLVSPSIVGDRFIQLTPVWTKGDALRDNAELGENRTATPLELDQIFGSINQLTVALGPNGANKPDASGQGALSRLLSSTAANFGGQGQQANTTIKNIARLTQTLSDNKDALFSTQSQVEQFVNALAKNDGTVRRFNDALASGADLLAGERQDLAAALHNLATALVAVRSFVHDNKTLLTSNISKLNTLASTLVKRRNEIDETLSQAPLALNNLGLAYNPATGYLNTRSNLSPFFASLQDDPIGALKKLCEQVPNSPFCGLLPSTNRVAALPRTSTPTDRHQFVDQTLAGLVGAQR